MYLIFDNQAVKITNWFVVGIGGNPNLYIGRCPEQVMMLIEKINSFITDVSAGSSEITI